MEEMGEVVEWNEEKEGGEEVRKEGEEGEGEQKVGGSDLEEEIAEMFSSSPSLNSSFSVSPATPTTTPSTTWWGLVGEGVRDIKEVASYLPFFLVCFSCLFKYIAAYSAAGLSFFSSSFCCCGYCYLPFFYVVFLFLNVLFLLFFVFFLIYFLYK